MCDMAPAPCPAFPSRRLCPATTAPPATCGPTRRSYRTCGRPSDPMARVGPAHSVTRVAGLADGWHERTSILQQILSGESAQSM